METTDYCSYELSKALKACGFDEPCDHYWYKAYTDSDKMEMRQASADDYNNDGWSVPHCSAPHIYHAQKWLREKKGIAINVIAHDGGRYHTERIVLPNCTIPESRDWYVKTTTPMVYSYEQALSAGIASALEMIKEGEDSIY